MSDLPWTTGDDPATRNGATGRKCRRHSWGEPAAVRLPLAPQCERCGAIRDDAASRRGRTNRSRGNHHELAVSRLYGGEKTGPLGGPEDIRGAEWRSQVKTHQRLAPAEWAKAFAGMDTQHDGRTPRLVLRYLRAGVAADDYIVVRGRDWLERFGRDE